MTLMKYVGISRNINATGVEYNKQSIHLSTSLIIENETFEDD